MKKYIETVIMFDDIKFGIDVKDKRLARGLTQTQLAGAIGYADGVSISAIETATKTDGMTVRRYMTLCNVLGLNPMHYWYCDAPISYADPDWTDTDGA